MEKKIDLLEILKDCPKGMKLDCTIFDGVITFYGLSSSYTYPILVSTKSDYTIGLTKYGQNLNLDEAKCIIFPKGKTTWEGFQRPFKDGEVVTTKLRGSLVTFIYKERISNRFVTSHVTLYDNTGICKNNCIELKEEEKLRFATEEEKENLFKSIKEPGYCWNAETKTLEKLVAPKFKVGDVVQHDDYKVRITEVNTDDALYGYESLIAKEIGGFAFNEQDYWELVQNKFDISTLKPFDSRVLVRNNNNYLWKPAIFGLFNNHCFYVLGGDVYNQCIPYEGNEHLFGTTKDCDEYYKNWE